MINPNPDTARHKEIPIWNAEDWLYEDFELGKRARSIRRTISEGESMLFNAIVLDMHPYVADDVFAKEEGMFGKRFLWAIRFTQSARILKNGPSIRN